MIRAVEASDIPQLSELMILTFTETFGHLYPPKELEQFLLENYHESVLAEQLSSSVLLLSIKDGRLVGYCQLNKNKPVPDADEIGQADGCMEIQRFYFHRDAHGTGLAQNMMNHCLELARKEGMTTLWLGVWENNLAALKFYKKFGFTQCGEKTFLVGSVVDRDLVFRLRLGGFRV
ncbi:hypothetical protein HDV03_002708 [Kappamyces sp. JEL0829]|nr:hypothetical protein HDV03_002708 [Kappamyces sp. JEL0829]